MNIELFAVVLSKVKLLPLLRVLPYNKRLFRWVNRKGFWSNRPIYYRRNEVLPNEELFHLQEQFHREMVDLAMEGKINQFVYWWKRDLGHLVKEHRTLLKAFEEFIMRGPVVMLRPVPGTSKYTAEEPTYTQDIYQLHNLERKWLNGYYARILGNNNNMDLLIRQFLKMKEGGRTNDKTLYYEGYALFQATYWFERVLNRPKPDMNRIIAFALGEATDFKFISFIINNGLNNDSPTVRELLKHGQYKLLEQLEEEGTLDIDDGDWEAIIESSRPDSFELLKKKGIDTTNTDFSNAPFGNRQLMNRYLAENPTDTEFILHQYRLLSADELIAMAKQSRTIDGRFECLQRYEFEEQYATWENEGYEYLMHRSRELWCDKKKDSSM